MYNQTEQAGILYFSLVINLYFSYDRVSPATHTLHTHTHTLKQCVCIYIYIYIYIQFSTNLNILDRLTNVTLANIGVCLFRPMYWYACLIQVSSSVFTLLAYKGKSYPLCKCRNNGDFPHAQVLASDSIPSHATATTKTWKITFYQLAAPWHTYYISLNKVRRHCNQ